jgi:hypothetical protein
MSTKLYTKFCVYGLFALLLISAIINRVIDPFWYYRDISIRGLNAIKTEFHSYENQIKPVIVKEIRPEVMIFSNSYFEIGLNPLHPALTDNGKYRSYNFGVVAAVWDKVYCNILFALENTDLRTVIIGIQLSAMPVIDCSDKQHSISRIEQQTLLISFDALRGSFNTIRHQHRVPTHTINGMFYYHRNNNTQIEQVFKFYFNRYLKISTNPSCNLSTSLYYPPWSYSNNTDDLKGLQKILEQLTSRNSRVKLIIYPQHALCMELLMRCGYLTERWNFLYQLAAVVEDFNNKNPLVELWDFQGTSEFLTERIQNYSVKYWQDYGHFNYEMGDAMLDVIFNRRSNDSFKSTDIFGVLVTPNSVVVRYRNFFENRKNFIQQNPWFLEDFNKFIK